MKRFCKYISILLILAMVLSFAGCGDDPQKALVGYWEGDIDFTQMLNLQLQDELEADMREHIHITSFKVRMALEFFGDDTFALTLHTASLPNTFEMLKEDMVVGFESYLKAVLEAQGVDMTVDDLMAAQGMTLRELVDQSFPDTMLNEIVEGLTSSLPSNGTYTADGKTLTLKGYTGNPFVETYTLKNDVLTLTTTDTDPIVSSLYPMIFNKFN